MMPSTDRSQSSRDVPHRSMSPDSRTEGIDARPRLLFLRFSRPDLPGFLQRHLRQQVECLAQHFFVTVVDKGVDFDEICARVEPDLVIFESGIFVGQRKVRNVGSNAGIPRLGFLHCDAFCPSRKTALADMARWGVEDFFTTSVALPHYTPEIADRIFVWANFIDPEIYRDYGLEKSVPVLFTGSQAAHYPWRNAVYQTVAPNVTCLTTPHFGWLESASPHMARMPQGERYARLINAAQIAPTCGTISMDVVRKHLEIPACNTCLVTERSKALLEAGFEDGVNCVFADPNDILDKLAWLLRDQADLERITTAGNRLVAARHTAARRSQVFEWFRLQKQLESRERIGQINPFLSLTITTSQPVIFRQAPREGVDQALLESGDRLLMQRDLTGAEGAFVRASNYYPTAESRLQLARCRLLQGDAASALQLLQTELATSFAIDSAMEPDPVEWSYFIVALLCAQHETEAKEHSRRFAQLSHPHLDHVRTLVLRIFPAGRSLPSTIVRAGRRATIHGLACQPTEQLDAEIAAMLAACGVAVEETPSRMALSDSSAPTRDNAARRLADWRYIDDWRRPIYKLSTRLQKRSRQAWRKLAPQHDSRFRQFFARLVRPADSTPESAKQIGAAFISEVGTTARVERVLSVGYGGDTWPTKSLLRGLRLNPMVVEATFTFLGPVDMPIVRRQTEPRFIFKSLTLARSSAAGKGGREPLERLFGEGTYGLVALDFTGANEFDIELGPKLVKADTVLLGGLNTIAGAACAALFLASPLYRIAQFRFDIVDSYAVFKRAGTCLLEAAGEEAPAPVLILTGAA